MPLTCRRKYVREEVLEKQFTGLLGRLHFDGEVLEWVRDALHASHCDQRREHEEAIKRQQAEYMRLDARIRAVYVDRLDGIVGCGALRLDVRPVARGAESLPARDLPAADREPVLHGRGRADSRTREQRAKAL